MYKISIAAGNNYARLGFFYKNMLENLEVSLFSYTFVSDLPPKGSKWVVRGQESPYFVKIKPDD